MIPAVAQLLLHILTNGRFGIFRDEYYYLACAARPAQWDGAMIRVLAEGKKKRPEKTRAELKEMLAEVRIEAECEVVGDLDIDELTKYSSDAAMVFIPLQLRGNQPTGPLGERLEDVFARLPVVALVLAGEDIDLDAEPEEGEGLETPATAETTPAETGPVAAEPETRGEDRERS